MINGKVDVFLWERQPILSIVHFQSLLFSLLRIHSMQMRCLNCSRFSFYSLISEMFIAPNQTHTFLRMNSGIYIVHRRIDFLIILIFNILWSNQESRLSWPNGMASAAVAVAAAAAVTDHNKTLVYAHLNERTSK